MKISELTENDVIHIRNKKEAKGIARLLNLLGRQNLNDHPYTAKWLFDTERCYLRVSTGELCQAEYLRFEFNIIPASKFLKQSISKKDLQEALSKVGEELSSMNERLVKLEAKSELSTANGIEIHFDEVTEGLPEKWYVTTTKQNIETIRNWWNNSGFGYRIWDVGSFYGLFKDEPLSKASYSRPDDATEITFDTFKKYVLKEEVKEAVELEVGKWYIYKYSGSIQFNVKDGVGYGINSPNREWIDNACWLAKKDDNGTNYRLATESEVFEALKAEAEKRGFKEEVTVNSLNGKGHLKINRHPTTLYFRSEQNDLVCSSDTIYLCQLFHNGKWATIIPQPEAIDFSKAGQLVESDVEIVMTTGDCGKDVFSGILISKTHDNNVRSEGYTSTTWNKCAFKLYEGSLTLQN